jgi:ParB-like chromosome segregation protein Spo0J
MEKVTKLPLKDILDEGVQTRESTRHEAVVEYASILRAGGKLDPAVVFKDEDGKIWLAAGHHRKAAHAAAKILKMPCIVKQGSRWDAIKFGIADNQKHRGERLTQEDRQHNARLVLVEQPQMSDRAIAKLCGVSPSSVGKHRNGLTVQIGQSAKRVGADGRLYDVKKLSRKSRASAALKEPSAVAKEISLEPLEDDACPPPCSKCGRSDLWETLADTWRCQHCDAAALRRSRKLLKLAAWLRRSPEERLAIRKHQQLAGAGAN